VVRVHSLRRDPSPSQDQVRPYPDRRYYQVRMPKDVRSRLGLRSKQVVDVRIALLESLVVELS
jgi:hypothetical protein